MDQSFHLSNVVLGLVFLPLLFFETQEVNWSEWWKPVIMSAVFFVATWLTFLAIRRGDISLVTPLMGTKVVFVAVGMVLITGKALTSALWIASFLTAIGIFVMGLGDIKGGSHLLFTILVTLGSAALYGLSDVLVNWWAGGFGAMSFLALSCLGVSLASVIMWFCQGRPSTKILPSGKSWAWWGAVLLAVQAMAIGLALSFFDDATGINVVYASRGLWVIVMVVLLGSLLGIREHKQMGRGFLWRVVGTLLLTIAIVIAVVDRANAASAV